MSLPGVSTFNVKDLHVHTSGILNVYYGNLNLYGKLRAYTGNQVTTTGADGVFYSSQSSSTSLSNYMLQAQAGYIHIKGTTRNITSTGEWAITLTGGVMFKVEMTSGNTASFQTDFTAYNMELITGNVDMLANTLYTEGGSSSGFPSLTINSGTIFTSSNSGAGAGNCVIARTTTTPVDYIDVYGKLVLNGASPYIQSKITDLFPGSTIEYGGTVNQNFANASFTGAIVINTYRNLILSGSGNKTPLDNFDVKEDITISGSAALVMGSKTATITGNWTSYGQAGITEGTSTIEFDSTGAQYLNTTGGENFYIMQKSNSGTLILNSAVNIVAAGNLNMQAGTIDANANTFGGTATSALNMSGGTIKLAKLNTTLPEFLITPYNITSGTIELDGAGVQTLRGARDYRNLTFSNSGTKGITSAINNITGTVTVSGSVLLDVLNNTMGGTGTNLTMTGTSVYRTAGSSQVKPDAAGTYNLGVGTTVEFNNNLTGLESIRFVGAATVNYGKVVVAGTSIGTASLATGIRFQSGGSFTVKNGSAFKQINTTGFSNSVTSAISNTNSPTIILEPGSTIEYNGDNQAISNQTINTPSDANYEGLLLTGTGNKTAPSGTLTIKGDLTKTGTSTFVHNSGTVIMNGIAAQDYTAAYPYIKFYNFTNNNTVDLSVNNELSIVKEFSFGANSKLNLRAGSNIILVSGNSGTANIGTIPATASISYFSDGKFTVERYISTGVSHGKSWQFLATPTNGGQTVNQAWQDTATAANQSRYGGYGTQITSNISPLPLRFDAYTAPGSSMKVYNAAGNNFTGIANTTTLPIYNQKGYMVFVRGDRTVTTSAAAANATVLRTSGRIFNPVSNIPPVTNIGATQFESLGNPYASAIDFSNDAAVIKSINVQKIFYVWDPKLGGSYGYGAYQTFTKGVGADNNYYVTPGGGNYGASGSINNSVQSGQAFFVHTFGGTGTITFTENAKLSNSAMVFRPVPAQGHIRSLRCNLSVINNDEPILLDGVLNEFDRSFSNNIDELDVQKIANSSENISIASNEKDFTVERMMIPGQNDTIFYKLGMLKVRKYAFEFTLANLYNDGLTAFLEDLYLNTQTILNLSGTTKVRFDVTNIPASYASNRFRIIFKKKTECLEINGSFSFADKN